MQTLPKAQRPVQICPFQSRPGHDTPCGKPHGTCSFRRYERSKETGEVKFVADEAGELRTFCPHRFEESGMIYRWVGETLLKCDEPAVLGEIGFLERPSNGGAVTKPTKSVGRIDKILVDPKARPLSWCALEAQAVYFSGKGMKDEFSAILNHAHGTPPFPIHTRRPDYRSSAPKRLMPQLMIKVPALSRWAKKVAVVVDRSFFLEMGRMQEVPDMSNCDVAWFVVKYEEGPGGFFQIRPDRVQFTTLKDSIDGLTAGVPVSQEVFEKRILAKLERLSGPVKVSSD